jgi:hypothetical protein
MMAKTDADVRFTVSVIDLAKLDVCKGGKCVQSDERTLSLALFSSGMDIKKGYTYEVCEHRPLSQNQAVFSGVYIGNERTDDEWLRSGNASLEVQIETSDPALRAELSDIARVAKTNKK